MKFSAPESSSHPATPNSRRLSQNHAPSTTPAGPPPTSFTGPSFTPAGPPPASSIFGSSHSRPGTLLTNTKPAHPPTGPFNTNATASLPTNLFAQQARTQNGTPAARRAFAVLDSSPPHGAPSDGGDEESEEQYEDDAEAEDVDEDTMDEVEDAEQDMMDEDDAHMELDDYTRGSRTESTLRSPRKGHLQFANGGSTIGSRGIKRSRYGEDLSDSLRSSRGAQRNTKRESAIPGIAKGMTTSSRPADLREPDDLILRTERLVSELDASTKSKVDSVSETIIWEGCAKLREVWQSFSDTNTLLGKIGPRDGKDAVTKANYLGSLLLQLHHPSLDRSAQSMVASRFGRSASLRGRGTTSSSTRYVPMPKVLLDWLNVYHNPFPDDRDEMVNNEPDPTASARFWDTIYSLVLRGHFKDVIATLRKADFSYAETALEDGYDEPGYQGRQLQNVHKVISDAVGLLESCPAVQGDWDVKGSDWTIFRHDAQRALDDLVAFAEGDSQGRDDEEDAFEAENFGIKSTRSENPMSLSTASRRAESNVPWTIYTNLQLLYNIALGHPQSIVGPSQDWLEATVFLTVWWSGDDDEVPNSSLAVSHRSLRQVQHTRPVDVAPMEAYRRRLSWAVARVTDDPEDDQLGIDTNSRVEIGLACICEDNVEGVVGLLRGWSMTITSAVVEVASAGGWLPQTRPRSGGLMEGLDKSDLMVLSYGEEDRSAFRRDDLMVQYAELVFGREMLRSSDGKTEKEGWEVAFQMLGRLDSAQLRNAKIGELLDILPLESPNRVDKVLQVCNGLSLISQAHRVAEKYADTLAESSTNYGDALLYYARARNSQKIKDVIDLLTSLCLVQSLAYPPVADLDARLALFVTSPKDALTQLSRTDVEAAQLLSTYLSGYATLRKFYDLRDQSVNPGQKMSTLRPIARKRAAVGVLMAVIDSAADSIRGGLYDPAVDTVVQVDGLLTLLGEALVFANQPTPILTLPQTFALLRSIEDLQAVSSLVFTQCEALFDAALAHYHGGPATADTPGLRKSLFAKSVGGGGMGASGLAGSDYQMLGSSGSVSSSGVLVRAEVRRGWDWRKGLGRAAKGEDVLRILRLGLAREIARAWAEGVE
ncbi:hypothetical protein BJ546DRAFT_355272 [Cryomyces antarcticus]